MQSIYFTSNLLRTLLSNPGMFYEHRETTTTTLMMMMAKPRKPTSFSLLLFLMILMTTELSNQVEDSQLEAFFSIQQILNYPPSLNSLHKNTDFCSIEPSPYLTIVCYEENITQIHTRWIDGFAPISGEICQMAKLGPLGLPAYRNYHLDEIKEATADFNLSNLLGEGSHGPVHKGIFGNGNVAAIRSLKLKKRRGVQAYTHHIELLSKIRHVHLVSALGHCFEYQPEDSAVSGVYLIFEFVPNGTLRDFISGQKPSWSQRIAAAIEVAKGIQFLQMGIMPGLFSNNIKITDVLLDNNLHVKVNSYNLPLLAENKEMIDVGLLLSGSKENGRALSNHEARSDVYDFGVILMEIIAGRPITSPNDVSVVKDLFQVGINADKIARKQVVDPSIHKEYSDKSVKILMELCVKSVSMERNERPSIEDVLWNLQFAGQVQDSWQGDYPSDRSSPVFTSQ